MDTKILAAMVVVSMLAFAGVVFAFYGWHGGNGNWTGPWQNATWQNETRCCRGIENNLTQNVNAIEIAQFEQALELGDYLAAKKLHEEYGFGGELFDKLNETTFAKYSLIYQLSTELRQELWLDGRFGFGPQFGPQFGGFGYGQRSGFAYGMHHQTTHCTNASFTTQTPD